MMRVFVTSVILGLSCLASAQESTASESSASATSSALDTSGTVLTDKRIPYDSIPYQVDTSTGDRGHMQGYNQCNSSTENQDSLCTTGIVNSFDDFCIWAPPEPNSVIGDVEGETVAWCTKAGHGTRLLPSGAITGAQFLRTPDYIQVTGKIDQTKVNIARNDSGGEMDPWGADLRGNPLGSLIYSSAFNGGGENYEQVIYWTNFMGANQFCIKACDPKGEHGKEHCQHIYDRMGCEYTVIADYGSLEGKFESCESDSSLFPGVYVGSDSQTSTYTQPPEGTEPNPPFTPVIPSSSNCVTHEAFTGLPSAA